MTNIGASNGLLRDYFPKGTDLGPVTIDDLVRVADEINHRPRKTLDWARPADLLHTAVHGEEDRPGQIGA